MNENAEAQYMIDVRNAAEYLLARGVPQNEIIPYIEKAAADALGRITASIAEQEPTHSNIREKMMDMSEPLSKEQLDAIRERARLVVIARERENEANKRMVDNRHSEPTVRTFQALQEIRIEAEEDLKYHADEDIPALLAHIDALEAERNRLQQAVNEAWDITSKPISSEVEMHPRITQIMDALQDALSKPTLDKYNVKLD